jgi:hypothetical protein
MTKKKTNTTPDETTADNVVPLNVNKPKPGVFERFRSKKPPTIGGVGTVLQALPLMKISDANDFVKLSPLEEHWSPELCFTPVPVGGEKKDLLHFIDEEIATKYLPEKRIKRFRLALGSKPYGVFFLAMIPTVNLDNSWNSSMVAACEQAKEHWVSVSSRKAEGRENYKIDFAKDSDAFPEPDWASAGDIERVVEVTFNGAMIDYEDHPALLRLTGRKPSLA